MSYIGDFRLGDTFDAKFTTVNTSGAPTTLAGTPVISAYVGNSTTEITAGITLTVDFDSRTGMHNVRVVATSGNGYATASNYQLVITTGTVGGTSVVGYVVAEFSIENRSALMPTTAARTLDVSAGGEAGLDWANIGSPTTAQNLSATNIDTDQVIASVSGAVGSVTGLTAANLDTTISSRLAPTTAGRTLDVTATGAAGVDWGNVENQSTAVNLSATNIDVDQVVASVSGAVGSVTGAVGSVTGNVGGNVNGNVVGSVGSVVGAVGSVTAAVTVGTNNDKTGYRLSATGVDDVLDEAVDGAVTLRESQRLHNSALGAKLSGGGSGTEVIRDLADSKDRITATVDSSGNRTAVVRDLT